MPIYKPLGNMPLGESVLGGVDTPCPICMVPRTQEVASSCGRQGFSRVNRFPMCNPGVGQTMALHIVCGDS